MTYTIRRATADDRDGIYKIKADSVRPYVEKIWGWDETFQRQDFDRDFASLTHFYVIEFDGRLIGFLQCLCESSYLDIAEIHLLPEYRGRGIGSDLLRRMQSICLAQNQKMRIGCFRENHRAKKLYQRLGFQQISETDTHYMLQYPNGTI